MTSGFEYDNEEDALNTHKKRAEQYFKHKIGQCFVCPNQPLAEDMICFSGNGNEKEYWICDMCHQAYYYHGYNNHDVYKALSHYDKQRTYLPDKELRDIKRREHRPITIDEVADFCWALEYGNNADLPQKGE